MSDLLKIVVKAAQERLDEDVVVMDFRGRSSLTDYFVIVSAKNDRMASSIVDRAIEKAEEAGYGVRNVEEGSQWSLVDLNDVILHVFVADQRQVYQLEKLWGDIPRIEVEP